MFENAKARQIEAESTRDQAADELRNASPDGIRQRLLDAQSMRLEAEGAANKAQVILDSGTEKGNLLSERLDSLTSRADEIQSEMAGREKSIKEWKLSIEKESVLLEEKEAERASLLEEHEELDNERKELVEERAEVRANANQKASAAINSRSMAEDIANSLAVREQNLAELLIEMAAESIDVAEEDADLPNVGDAQKIVNNFEKETRQIW